MHDEDEFEVREEEIIHNKSIASVTEINITHQTDEEYSDEEEIKRNIFLAKYNDVDTTNRIYSVKQNQLVDVKIKIQFEFYEVEKEIEELDADINRLKIVCHHLEIKKNETNQTISEHNVFQKCVEKKLDTKSLIFDKIIPSQIEKQSVAVNTLIEEYDTMKNSWIERTHKIQYLMESNKKLMKDYYNYSSDLADLTKYIHSLKYQEVQSLYNENVTQQQAQREIVKCITDKQLHILKELSNEHLLFNELINKEMNVQETVLRTIVTQEEKSTELVKTLEEKKVLLANIEHGLLPSIRSKSFEANNLLQNNDDMNENLKNKIDELDRDLVAETRTLNELVVNSTNLDIKYNKQKDDFKEKNMILNKSISEHNRKKDNLEKAKRETDLRLNQYEEEASELLNTTNKITAETVDAENKQVELTTENNSIIASIDELKSNLINFNGSEENDIDQTEKEIRVLISDSEKLDLEISEKCNVYSEELRKVDNINLADLETKLERLKREIKSVNETIETKNIIRNSLTTKVTKLELGIQKCIRFGMKKPPSFHNTKLTVRNSRSDVGILKKIGEKSPSAKHVHFRASLSGLSSQATTEDVSESANSELIGKLCDAEDISVQAPLSPPTRLSSKKGKYN